MTAQGDKRPGPHEQREVRPLGLGTCRHVLAAAAAAAALVGAGAATAQTTVTIGIGTQDTTTNTVTTGVIVRELKLFEKHLPKDGKYANIKFQLEWNNFTSGPPVTNGM